MTVIWFIFIMLKSWPPFVIVVNGPFGVNKLNLFRAGE